MIWLLGKDGMLGSMLQQELLASGTQFHACGRECDVTVAEQLTNHAPPTTPDWVINCTGFTAVDRAETERTEAWAVNCDGVENIARYCRTAGARLVHISTDYVFDGTDHRGYDEQSPTSPLNAYGASKEAGEQMVAFLLKDHIMIRTAWLFAEIGQNFVTTMLRLMKAVEPIEVVDDQHGTPTYARDLARAIIQIVEARRFVPGILHFTNSGLTTWYHFACCVQRRAIEMGLLEHAVPIHSMKSDKLTRKAQRPNWSALKSDRIRTVYRVIPRPWTEALDECLERMIVSHESSREQASRPSGLENRPT